MTCEQLLELVEPIAAGDVAVDAGMRAHLESCPQCAASLAAARRIEAALAAREAPVAPDLFAAAVFQRIRREGWRAEEQVDRLFNLAIVASALLVAGGVLALLNVGAVMAASAAFVAFVTGWASRAAIDAAPTLGIYVAAAGLLVSALGMWWWAERRLSM